MTQQPLISIIVPVLNSQQYIGPCLDSLLSQDYPKDKFDIIVLDNGSTDKTVDIVKKYHVKLLIKTKCNVSALRNWGVRQAQGEIFAFIDADCIASQDWLMQAYTLLQSNNAGVVGCRYALPDSTTLIERTWDMIDGGKRKQQGPVDWVPAGNLIIRRDLFEGIQGFDEYLITMEDVDICQRIIKTGGILYSDPKVAVKHLGNAKTLKKFFMKEKWRGEGVIQNSFRHFPRIELNNALIFGFVSLIFALGIMTGIGWWIINGNDDLLIVSISGLLFIPFLITIKTLIQRPEWDKFFVLFLLLVVYGLARASSLFSDKLWKTFNVKK